MGGEFHVIGTMPALHLVVLMIHTSLRFTEKDVSAKSSRLSLSNCLIQCYSLRRIRNNVNLDLWSEQNRLQFVIIHAEHVVHSAWILF